MIIRKVEEKLSQKFSVVDMQLAEAALKAQNFENPFNLSLEEARNLGNAIGCNFFILIKAETINRITLEKGVFKETYTVFFFVSSKTGKLLSWKLLKTEDLEEEKSVKKLFLQIEEFLTRFVTEIQLLPVYDLKLQEETKFPEFDEKSKMRPPVPYLRIKPEYPTTANLYLVEATIDVAVDIDEKGNIVRTEVLRWAGFGLEEAVMEAIRKMNWRPAEMNGKFLPSRVFLRYNFKDIKGR